MIRLVQHTAALRSLWSGRLVSCFNGGAGSAAVGLARFRLCHGVIAAQNASHGQQFSAMHHAAPSSAVSRKHILEVVERSHPSMISDYSVKLGHPEEKVFLVIAVLQNILLTEKEKTTIVSNTLMSVFGEYIPKSSLPQLVDLLFELISRHNVHHFVDRNQPSLVMRITSLCREGLLLEVTYQRINSCFSWLSTLDSLEQVTGRCILKVAAKHSENLNASMCFTLLRLLEPDLSRLSAQYIRTIFKRLMVCLSSAPPLGSTGVALSNVCGALRGIAALRLYDRDLLSALHTYLCAGVRAEKVQALEAFSAALYVFSLFWFPATDLFELAHLAIQCSAEDDGEVSIEELVHLNWAYLAQGLHCPPRALACLETQLGQFEASLLLDHCASMELHQLLPYLSTKEAGLVSAVKKLCMLETEWNRDLFYWLEKEFPDLAPCLFTENGVLLAAALIAEDRHQIKQWPRNFDPATLSCSNAGCLEGRPVALLNGRLSLYEADSDYVLGPLWRKILLLEQCGWEVRLLLPEFFKRRNYFRLVVPAILGTNLPNADVSKRPLHDR